MTQESTTGSGAGDQTTRAVVSNLFGPTFFSALRPDVRETGRHKSVISQRSGKML